MSSHSHIASTTSEIPIVKERARVEVEQAISPPTLKKVLFKCVLDVLFPASLTP